MGNLTQVSVPGTARFEKMIKRRRHKDKASANDNSASLKKGNVSSFVPIIFIATTAK